jgi:hypothetical protein
MAEVARKETRLAFLPISTRGITARNEEAVARASPVLSDRRKENHGGHQIANGNGTT